MNLQWKRSNLKSFSLRLDVDFNATYLPSLVKTGKTLLTCESVNETQSHSLSDAAPFFELPERRFCGRTASFVFPFVLLFFIDRDFPDFVVVGLGGRGTS